MARVEREAKDLLQKQRRFLKAEAEKCERLTLEASEAESQPRAKRFGGGGAGGGGGGG